MSKNSPHLSRTRPDAHAWAPVSLTDDEFRRFARLIYEAAGVHLADSKKALVQGRLTRRLRHFGVQTYSAYLRILAEQPEERTHAIDLLTTHETSFFRHSAQFDLLSEIAQKSAGLNVWSAACSTGEEAYTMAMILADAGIPWQITGTDVSHHAVEKARLAEYSMKASSQIPMIFLKRFCLRGTGAKEGVFKVSKELRERVRFLQMNLLEAPPFSDVFDVIFIRNAIIYFDAPTRDRVVANLLARLKSGGCIFLGGSESLRALDYGLEMLMPAVYRKA